MTEKHSVTQQNRSKTYRSFAEFRKSAFPRTTEMEARELPPKEFAKKLARDYASAYRDAIQGQLDARVVKLDSDVLKQGNTREVY